MAFDPILDSEILQDKAVTAALMEKIQGNFDDHETRLAALTSNIVPNGSFEAVDALGDPTNWEVSTYTGGSYAIVATDQGEGGKCIKFTRSATPGTGGGYCTSDYIPCSPFREIPFSLMYKVSAAGIKVKVRVYYYDKGKVAINNVDLYTSTTNPTLWSLLLFQNMQIPFNARFLKIELHGGVDDTAVAGDVYFDGVSLGNAEAGTMLFTESSINQGEILTSQSTYQDGSAQSITIPAGAKWLYVKIDLKSNVGGVTAYGRFRIGSNYSTEFSTDAGGYVGGWCYLNVASLQGAQTLYIQYRSSNFGSSVNVRCPSANHKYCKGGRYVVDEREGTGVWDAA